METAVISYHLLWIDITEDGRQVAHYSVCGLRKLDWNCLESFEMWCRRRKEKIIWIGLVKNEEVAHYEGSRRSGISERQQKSKNAKRIGHILCTNCLLKHVMERKAREKDRSEAKTWKKA